MEKFCLNDLSTTLTLLKTYTGEPVCFPLLRTSVPAFLVRETRRFHTVQVSNAKLKHSFQQNINNQIWDFFQNSFPLLKN